MWIFNIILIVHIFEIHHSNDSWQPNCDVLSWRDNDLEQPLESQSFTGACKASREIVTSWCVCYEGIDLMSVRSVERHSIRRDDYLPRVLEAVNEPRAKLAWRGLRHAKGIGFQNATGIWWRKTRKESIKDLVLGMTWGDRVEDFMSCPKL